MGWRRQHIGTSIAGAIQRPFSDTYTYPVAVRRNVEPALFGHQISDRLACLPRCRVIRATSVTEASPGRIDSESGQRAGKIPLFFAPPEQHLVCCRFNAQPRLAAIMRLQTDGYQLPRWSACRSQ